MNLIDELRTLAEDLYVNGYNRYSAAMSKAADELENLQRYRTAYTEWIDKTEWVQESLPPKYLGMHRADALKDMISELEERTLRLECVISDLKQQVRDAEKVRDELLGALRLISTARSRDFGIDYAKGCADAAIAKATGEQP